MIERSEFRFQEKTKPKRSEGTEQKYLPLKHGYVTKRAATKIHVCSECSGTIEAGTEYYMLKFRGACGGWIAQPVCEKCWDGPKLSARHGITPKNTQEVAESDGRWFRPNCRWRYQK